MPLDLYDYKLIPLDLYDLLVCIFWKHIALYFAGMSDDIHFSLL